MRAIGIIAAGVILVGCTTRLVPPGEDLVPTLYPGLTRSVLAFAPAPEYPAEAKSQQLQGDCVILMVIDKPSGRVTAATIEKSTGHPILDRAALDACKRWQFKPGMVSKVRTPMTFKLHR